MASESMVESNLLQSGQILFMADLDIPESHDMFTPKQNNYKQHEWLQKPAAKNDLVFFFYMNSII
jgi:hypothetical protein